MDFWTMNDEPVMRELFCAGADGLITDRVELALEVLKDLRTEARAD